MIGTGPLEFPRRSEAEEWMDGDCDYDTFRDCLTDLARVNRMTLAYRPTLSFFDRLHAEGHLPQGRPLNVLDVGFGQGDMLRKVAAWANRRGVPVTLTGIDLSPWSAKAARDATLTGLQIDWRTGDVFTFRPDRPADVILSALVAHHMPDDAVIRFLRWQEETARIGWFVNDLHRHRFSYHGFKVASRLLRMHPFVQHDGPVSIARSFVRQDWARHLSAAGVQGARVEGWMPFRLCVSRVRTG